LNFGGLPNKTKFNFDLSIDDGVFEGLELGHVTGMGLYDSRRLYFNQFSAIRGKRPRYCRCSLFTLGFKL